MSKTIEPDLVDESGLTREELEELYREGLEVQSLTQWQLALRKFLKHRLAMFSLTMLLVIFILAMFADVITIYEFDQPDVPNRSLAPTLEGWHIFGTDKIGRDYFTRVLYGTRTSIRVAAIVSSVSTVIGITIGGVAGYYGKWVDELLMRFTGLFLIVPFLTVLLILSSFLGGGSPNRVALILAFLSWPGLARIVRSSFLSLREKEFVDAAKALGASDARIIFRHILPNSLGPIIVNATLTIAGAILIEAALSFLGFGIQPPTPALGKLIADGQNSMQTAWWLVTMPGVFIVSIALAINFVGDGLRDALDPTQKLKA